MLGKRETKHCAKTWRVGLEDCASSFLKQGLRIHDRHHAGLLTCDRAYCEGCRSELAAWKRDMPSNAVTLQRCEGLVAAIVSRMMSDNRVPAETGLRKAYGLLVRHAFTR